MSIASLWPTEQQLLSTDQLKASRSRLTPGFESLCRSMRIDDDLNEYLAGLYLPFAAWLARRHALNDGTLVVGLCGGQGSGKSTIARILSFVLASEFDLRVVGFSIDDIYKTREAREALEAAETLDPEDENVERARRVINGE